MGGDVAPFPYDPSTEAWPINFPSVSSTLSCVGGATVSQANPLMDNKIYLSTSSTVQGCNLGYVQLTTGLMGGVPTQGIRITDNAFSTAATGTVLFDFGAENFSILNNTNITYLSLHATNTNGLIQGNTFYGNQLGPDGAIMLSLSVSSTQIEIRNNSFLNQLASNPGGPMRAIVLTGSDIVFATNTIRYPVDFGGANLDTSILSTASGTNYIGGNFIDSPSAYTDCSALSIGPGGSGSWVANYTIIHNTLRIRGTCTNGRPLVINGYFDDAGIDVTATVNYNLLFNDASPMADKAIEYSMYASNGLTQSNDYNGYYGFSNGVMSAVIMGSATDVSGPHTRTTNPFLKINDVSTTNDLETAEFSGYLDVNGSLDIGATVAVRRSTSFIDIAGPVDYTIIDAVNTSGINDYIRTGDTVSIAAGSYPGFAVSSTDATSTISIIGAGNSTVITAVTDEDGILMNGVTSSTISNLRVTGATAGTASYSVTKMLFSYFGTDYNQAIVPFEVDPDTMLIDRGSGCDLDFTTADTYDLTDLTLGGTETFHVALVDIEGFKETMLVPNSIDANEAALEASCGGGGGGGGGGDGPPTITVDAFIENVFVPTGGVYSYDSSSVASAMATLLAGVTNPPRIDLISSGHAGIRLTNAPGSTVTAVTSTENYYGIAFAGTTENATLSESVIQNSGSYDLVSTASATNTIDNVSFTYGSSSVDGVGDLLVKFNIRAFVGHGVSGLGISGIAVTSTAGNGTETDFGTTTPFGYTIYQNLPAYVISSVAGDLLNGGYNPYTFHATGTGYQGITLVSALTTRNQTRTLFLLSDSAPAAPTAASSTSLTTTDATLIWTDNSDDEANFAVDYIAPYLGQAYPGTLVYVSSGTSTDITGLTPGETYAFRVAAVSSVGTSTYAIADAFALPAMVPGAPVLSALSRTSLSVTLDTETNATSVQYAIYSSTLGGYLDAAGAVVSLPVWQTSSTWGTVTVSNLVCNTAYSFTATARNTDSTETVASSASSVTTSACAVVSSGGGGGGAVGGGSGGGAIQVFFGTPIVPAPTSTTTQPIGTTTPVSSSPVIDETPVPTPVVTPTPSTTPVTLLQFIQQGGDAASRALGQGEREAILRDLQEVLARPGASIPVTDLMRVANGQIPLTRNIAYERQMVPRALATFRTLFGHAPNFKNASENLAWNTLMYRIRFTRNLTAERSGITDFRRVFRTIPQSPFQWAVVRVMGYIQ